MAELRQQAVRARQHTRLVRGPRVQHLIRVQMHEPRYVVGAGHLEGCRHGIACRAHTAMPVVCCQGMRQLDEYVQACWHGFGLAEDSLRSSGVLLQSACCAEYFCHQMLKGKQGMHLGHASAATETRVRHPHLAWSSGGSCPAVTSTP
jgi:hypothetical protein